jgi:hypothetical protein
LEELLLVKGEEQRNDAKKAAEQLTGTAAASHSDKAGGGLIKLWICMGLCPSDPARMGGSARTGAYILWGWKK